MIIIKIMAWVNLIWTIILSILLIYVLETDYEFKYCDCNDCYVAKQKIFDYIIGRD